MEAAGMNHDERSRYLWGHIRRTQMPRDTRPG